MLLDGRELAGYLKERQARRVRQLRAKKVFPKLAIVQVGDNPASSAYIKVKQKYGEDIKAAVAVFKVEIANIKNAIADLNDDDSVHGIIVQLPLPEGLDTSEILNAIAPNKDVDGLGHRTEHEAATPTAILWLLAGNNIEFKNRRVALVGHGRLVGRPLQKMLEQSGVKPKVFDEHSQNLAVELKEYDLVISATGQAGLIKSEMIQEGAVVVDAGTAEAGGKLVGDVDPVLYERSDIKVSPVPGGVGPVTVAVLFENLLKAASG